MIDSPSDKRLGVGLARSLIYCHVVSTILSGIVSGIDSGLISRGSLPDIVLTTLAILCPASLLVLPFAIFFCVLHTVTSRSMRIRLFMTEMLVVAAHIFAILPTIQ